MIEIRPANPDDTESLSNIKWRASWANEADRTWLAANEAEARELEPGDILVLTEDNQLRAYIALQPTSAGAIEIDGLFTDPSHMRRGFARALVEAAIDRAIEAGCECLTTSANRNAVPFYRSMGFAECDQTEKPGTQMILQL